MLKTHKFEDKYVWLALIPSILVFGGLWTLPFHYLLDMAAVGAIFGVGHVLMLGLAHGFAEVRLGINDLQEMTSDTQIDNEYQ
ncbi:MAG: hypothetical protein ACI8Q1_003178 [Parvicella sp.]|jgi:uncharacterized membrane protein YjdF